MITGVIELAGVLGFGLVLALLVWSVRRRRPVAVAAPTVAPPAAPTPQPEVPDPFDEHLAAAIAEYEAEKHEHDDVSFRRRCVAAKVTRNLHRAGLARDDVHERVRQRVR